MEEHAPALDGGQAPYARADCAMTPRTRVGIHLDPEVLTAVMVDLLGSIVASRSKPITAHPLVDQVIGRTSLARAGLTSATIRSLRRSFPPGPVDTASARCSTRR